MAEFKDRNGRDWQIRFDFRLLEKIETSIKVPVEREDGTKILQPLDIADETGRGMLLACSKGATIVRVCWILCEDQAKAAKITAEAFGEAMASGEVIEGAEAALRQALTDFTRPTKRDALSAVLHSQDELLAAEAELRIAQANDPETKEKLKDAIRAKMTDVVDEVVARMKGRLPSANDLPATLESTPVQAE